MTLDLSLDKYLTKSFGVRALNYVCTISFWLWFIRFRKFGKWLNVKIKKNLRKIIIYKFLFKLFIWELLQNDDAIKKSVGWG